MEDENDEPLTGAACTWSEGQWPGVHKNERVTDPDGLYIWPLWYRERFRREMKASQAVERQRALKE